MELNNVIETYTVDLEDDIKKKQRDISSIEESILHYEKLLKKEDGSIRKEDIESKLLELRNRKLKEERIRDQMVSRSKKYNYKIIYHDNNHLKKIEDALSKEEKYTDEDMEYISSECEKEPFNLIERKGLYNRISDDFLYLFSQISDDCNVDITLKEKGSLHMKYKISYINDVKDPNHLNPETIGEISYKIFLK